MNDYHDSDTLQEIRKSLAESQSFKDSLADHSIKSAIMLSNIVRYIKLALAIIIIVSYLFFDYNPKILIIIAIILLLISPYGFMHNFLQELIKYNTSTLEYSQKLNAEETNYALTQINDKIKILENKIDILTTKSDSN